MKKTSKFIIFILLTLVVSLFKTNNVFAYYVGQKLGDDNYNTSSHKHHLSNAVINGLNGNTNYYVYDHWLDSGHTTYCLDVARTGGGSNVNLEVKRVLDQSVPKDAVILYILSSGYSDITKTLAIRAFTPFNGDLAKPQLSSWEKYRACASINSGIAWAKLDNESMAAIFNKDSLTDAQIKSMGSHSSYSYCSNEKLNTDNGYVSAAKELFLSALKYGAKVRKNGIVRKEIVYSQPEFAKDVYEGVNEDGVVKAVREIRFSAVFKKFNDGTNKPVNVIVTPDENKYAVGTVYEYQVAGTDTWTQFNSSTDFNNVLTTDNVMINFRIGVKAPVSSKESFYIKFNVETKYTDDKVLTGALLYGSSTTQRFYIYDSSSNKQSPYKVQLKWDDVIGYCTNILPNKSNTAEFKEYLKTCCRGQNEPGFNITTECQNELNKVKTEAEKENVLKNNKYCKIKTEYCDVCNGTISVPQTCSEFGDGETPKCEDNADAVVKDNDNVKLCILDYSDEANNDYKLTTDANVASNDYCNVYCKEDYKFSLPLGRWVTAGRSFAVAMNVNATKTCYTDLINYDKFITDLSQQKALLDANVNNLVARGRYQSIMNQYNACAKASWDSDIKFNPNISLTYDESDYVSDGNRVVFEKAKKVVNGKEEESLNVTNNNKWLCNGSDVDDYYNECKGGKAVSTPEAQTHQTLTNYYDPTTFAKTNIDVPLTKYAKKVSFAKAVYAPKTTFYTKVGSGTISTTSSTTNQELTTNLILNDEEIANVGKLPIALKRSYGAYKFDIFFNDIGEYFNSNALGRLVGGPNSVALKNGNTTFKGEYACSYVVNCPECNVGCVDDPARGIFCDITGKDNPETCIECKPDPITYKKDNYNIFVARQISLSNINPSDRKLGVNLSDLKGRTAVKGIEEKGEEVYNGNDGKAQYTITLTPNETRKLQQYNNLKIDDGGYASMSDFECYSYSTIVSKEYYDKAKENDYIICKSKLLSGNKEFSLKNVEISGSDNLSWIEACDKETNSVCIIGGFYGPAYK